MIIPFLNIASMLAPPSRWQGHTEPEYKPSTMGTKSFKKTKARRKITQASRKKNWK